MSTWLWEFDPTRDFVLDGLPQKVVAQIDEIAARLAVAAEVAYPSLPEPPPGVSRLLSHAEGDVIVYYQEDYRDPECRGEGSIVIVRVVHAEIGG